MGRGGRSQPLWGFPSQGEHRRDRAPITPTPAPTTRPTRPAPKTRPVQSPPISSPPAPVYYQNCDAVRAAGKAPLYRSDPGYRPQLDRDGDGVACE